MDWMKIFSAILIVGFIIYIWPRAKYWMKNSPKAEAGDWQAAIVPILFVVGFVVLLIMLV
jgi:archaellum biogenesis protein FlaJ (TadC family)